MNRSIPIIAIQLNAMKIDDKVVINFTTVLDIYEAQEDEENLGGEEVGRPFWEKKAHAKSIAILDVIISIAQKFDPNARLTYNKNHVAIGTTRRNYMWLNPRKSPHICHVEIKLAKDHLEDTKTTFDDLGIAYSQRKDDNLAISMHGDDIKKHHDKISEMINKSIDVFS
jgi:hypothetical protein